MRRGSWSSEIRQAKREGVKVLKVIHGYRRALTADHHHQARA
jgi:hypothetical protein